MARVKINPTKQNGDVIIPDMLLSEITGGEKLANIPEAVVNLQKNIIDLTESTKSIVPDVSVSTYAKTSTLSENAREGQMNVKVSGNTLKNEVVNGNFADGTTGWSSSTSTSTVANNTLSNTGSNASAIPYVVQYINFGNNTKKFYGSAKVRVTNSNCINLILRYYGSTGKNFKEIATPVINTWYPLSGIITNDDTDASTSFILRHDYADAATANGKVMEVKDVICIDMGSDASNPLYNKTVAEMDALAGQNYFDGLSSVVAGSVKTVGKNLFDKNKYSSGYYVHKDTGVLTSVAGLNASDYIPIKPNTSYVFSGYTAGYTATNAGLAFYDERYAYISGSATGGAKTSPVNAKYIRLSFGVNDFNTFQLEEGTTATTYEPYTETIRTLPSATFRSLPNGVRDYVDGDRLVQNCQTKTIVAGDVFAMTTGATNLDYAKIYKPTDYINYNSLTNTGLILESCPILAYADNIANIGTVNTNYSTTQFLVGVAKGTTLAQAQTLLTGKKLIYQLATPVVTELLPSTLKSNPKGSVIYLNQRDGVDFYTTNIPVENTALPIKTLVNVKKVNVETGTMTNIALSTCTVATGGLTFTSTALASGDLVFYEYEFDGALTTTPLLEYGYENEKGDFPATNLITNGDFSGGTTGWSAGLGSISVLNNELTLLATAQNGEAKQTPISTIGNKYYVKIEVKANSNLVLLAFGTSAKYHSGNGQYEKLSLIHTATATGHVFHLYDGRASGWDNVYGKYAKIIDLTATFGAGKEPTLAEMDAIMALYPNSWFNGTVNPLLTSKQIYNELDRQVNLKADIVQEDWITPTLLNGFTQFQTCVVGYRKTTFGEVEFKGAVSGTAGLKIFDIPVAYVPKQVSYFPTANAGRTSVGTDGQVIATAFTTYSSLEGIRYSLV